MSLVAGDIGSKSLFPDGLQVDHLSENTVGHGVRVRGISNGDTPAAGDVGEQLGTERALATGVKYFSAQTTTAYNGATSGAVVSLTLNKGVYLLTAISNAQEADAVSRFFYSSLVNGSNTLITQTNFGFTTVPASGYYCGGFSGIPVVITVDSTVVGLRMQVPGATTLTLNTKNEMWAVRIA